MDEVLEQMDVSHVPAVAVAVVDKARVTKLAGGSDQANLGSHRSNPEAALINDQHRSSPSQALARS